MSDSDERKGHPQSARDQPNTSPSLGDFPEPTARVDAVGLLCPVPITRSARTMKDLSPGEVLELRADDRIVLIDLPNWCRSWRHLYLGHQERGSVLHLYVRKGGD